MKIALRNQKRNLADYLRAMERLPLSYSAPDTLPVRRIEARLPSQVPNLLQCDLDFLFRYEIFPPEILVFYGQWQLEGRMMRVGDIIVQQAQIPPCRTSVKLVFGVRILSVLHDDDCAGFSYGTLVGHPETGTNTFLLSRAGSQPVAAVITTATPGLLISRLLAPVFTNRYVAWCNRQALHRIRESFLARNGRSGWADGDCPT